jgi:hypothetical protein
LRIDYDLLREILLVVEDVTDGRTNYPYSYISSALEYDEAVIWYHLKYLRDTYYIEAGNGFFIDITPLGRAYLDSVRDETVWAKVKDKMQVVKSVPLEVVKEVATNAVQNLLGLP